jgi:regulator of protease activity HflC (stomatin/prohibitin superfamily)
MIGFFKGQPTDYIIKYVGGRITREGPGLTFYYLPFNTQIVAVPTSSTDANFVFNEVTNNFQAVTIQGQFTYRIVDPRKAADLLNFIINPRAGVYVSNDPERLRQRIANIIQMETRSHIQQRSLEETLNDSQDIAGAVLQRIRESSLLDPMGIELLSVYFLAAQPTPEVAKALEADYRESLLRKADEAIYARRAAAVEEERKIKANELNTDITLEQQREQLVEMQGGNARREAEHRGKALELETEYRARALERDAQARAKGQELMLAPYRTLDPRAILALAMKELGENAGKVGNLTITSEILAELMRLQHPSE